MANVQMHRQCSFAEWMKRCESMDTWDKSLENMRYCDWLIHRRLGEEAGLHCRYLIPARGSGKSMFYWPDHEEDEDCPEVTVNKYKWTEALIDKDILGWDNPRKLE